MPSCGASLELQSRAVDERRDLPTDLAGCRLSLESYMLSLERWALCVRNEVELRKLEARRRLDCLAHNRKSCF